MKVGFLVKLKLSLSLSLGSGLAPWGLCLHINTGKPNSFTLRKVHFIESLNDGISLGTRNDGITLDTENMYMSDPQGFTSWVPATAKSSEPSPMSKTANVTLCIK